MIYSLSWWPSLFGELVLDAPTIPYWGFRATWLLSHLVIAFFICHLPLAA